MTHMDLPSFDDPIGLFPLPNVVLLPGGTLPLQVHEPRYRAMVRDALDGEAVIGMALLRPGYEALYHTNRARIHPVVCVGRIREHIRLPDGRFFLNLAGLCRARVREEDHVGEYRTAVLQPMIPTDYAVATDGECAARDLLRRVVASRGLDSWPDIDRCRQRLEMDGPLSDLVDLVAAELLPNDAVDIRQHLLEELDVLARARTLLAELQVLLQKLELRRGPFEAGDHPPASMN